LAARHWNAAISISGMDQHRLFFVRGGSLTVTGVTLAHGLGAGGNGGKSPGSGAGGGAAGMGGAIFINAGAVTLRDMVVTASVARGGNGGTSAGNGLAQRRRRRWIRWQRHRWLHGRDEPGWPRRPGRRPPRCLRAR
jgi:hypothetical protein